MTEEQPLQQPPEFKTKEEQVAYEQKHAQELERHILINELFDKSYFLFNKIYNLTPDKKRLLEQFAKENYPEFEISYINRNEANTEFESGDITFMPRGDYFMIHDDDTPSHLLEVDVAVRDPVISPVTNKLTEKWKETYYQFTLDKSNQTTSPTKTPRWERTEDDHPDHEILEILEEKTPVTEPKELEALAMHITSRTQFIDKLLLQIDPPSAQSPSE